MANVKISELPAATLPLAGTEATPTVQGGETVQAPASAFGPTLPLTVANGGTGITSGTSGGVPYFSASGTISSSGALTINRIVLGGGAGGAPAVVGSLGTTTTVLHGNAAGAPTFGAVSLTADVTGTLPIANGGTGQTSANAALNALLPSQTAQSGNFLTTNGTNTSWAAAGGGGGGGEGTIGAYVRLDQLSAINVPDSTFTVIPWELEDFDTGTFWDVGQPTRFTAATTGVYQINTTLLVSMGDAGAFSIFFQVNGDGANFGGGGIVFDGVTGTAKVCGTAVLELNAADYVEVYVFQDSGNTAQVTETTPPQGTSFSILTGGGALPDQTGHDGNYLLTDGTSAFWAPNIYNQAFCSVVSNAIVAAASSIGIGPLTHVGTGEYQLDVSDMGFVQPPVATCTINSATATDIFVSIDTPDNETVNLHFSDGAPVDTDFYVLLMGPNGFAP